MYSRPTPLHYTRVGRDKRKRKLFHSLIRAILRYHLLADFGVQQSRRHIPLALSAFGRWMVRFACIAYCTPIKPVRGNVTVSSLVRPTLHPSKRRIDVLSVRRIISHYPQRLTRPVVDALQPREQSYYTESFHRGAFDIYTG